MKETTKLFAIATLIVMGAVGTACSTDKNSPAAAPAPAPAAAPVVQAPVTPAPVVQAPVVQAPVTPAPVAVADPTSVSTDAPPPAEQPVTPPPPPAQPVTPPPAAPAAPVTMALSILSVNGLEVDGSGSVTVTPGESITLTADALAGTDGCTSLACAERENLGVDQFTFSADDRASDLCDAAEATFCSRSSNFSVTGNSVTFKVPKIMEGDITITVRQNNTSLTGILTLKSADARTGHGPIVVPTGNRGQNGHGQDPRRGG